MLSIETDPGLSSISTARNKQDPLGLAPLPIDNRKRFLRFILSQEYDALLPLTCISEVMQLPKANILPIPEMPRCILGVCSWQGETLWLVDLNHLVGCQSLHPAQMIETLSIVVIRHNNQILGLVVEQVNDIDLIDEETIQTGIGLCPAELEPFILGHCSQPSSILLNVSAIVNAPQLHTYSGEYV